MDSWSGELAALGAALSFSVTSVCYTLAGRKVSSVTAIAMSLPISWLMLLALHRLTLGSFFPAAASVERWFYLGTSGILAFVVSNYFMLNAYQAIGPRLTMLIASLAPLVAALLAWLFLDQSLPANATLGIAVVTFGIVAVVAERGQGKGASNPGETRQVDMRRGLVAASLGTLIQATAFILATQGLVGGFPPISGTLIRITGGVVALWLFIALQRRVKATATIFRGDLSLFLLLATAAFSGPVLAGALLLLSLQQISVGIATTLSHTTAIMLIPIGYFLFKERITLRAITGTVVTVVGIGILFS